MFLGLGMIEKIHRYLWFYCCCYWVQLFMEIRSMTFVSVRLVRLLCASATEEPLIVWCRSREEAQRRWKRTLRRAKIIFPLWLRIFPAVRGTFESPTLAILCTQAIKVNNIFAAGGNWQRSSFHWGVRSMAPCRHSSPPGSAHQH